jgi:hypothetical protein
MYRTCMHKHWISKCPVLASVGISNHMLHLTTRFCELNTVTNGSTLQLLGIIRLMKCSVNGAEGYANWI